MAVREEVASKALFSHGGGRTGGLGSIRKLVA